MEQGRMEEALQLLEQALAIHARSAIGRTRASRGNLAVVHLDQGRVGEAVQLYEQGLGDPPPSR
jgi:tetratricopeptide (TPR) repeat protein